MGCDIHCYSEGKMPKDLEDDREYLGEFFDDTRSYRLFGWLAGVRNYSAVKQCQVVKPGLPILCPNPKIIQEFKALEGDAHSEHHVYLEDLLGYDYDQLVEDRRVIRDGNGGCTCEPGEGEVMSLREFLGKSYFDELDKMKQAGVFRLIFWFDN